MIPKVWRSEPETNFRARQSPTNAGTARVALGRGASLNVAVAGSLVLYRLAGLA